MVEGRGTGFLLAKRGDTGSYRIAGGGGKREPNEAFPKLTGRGGHGMLEGAVPETGMNRLRAAGPVAFSAPAAWRSQLRCRPEPLQSIDDGAVHGLIAHELQAASCGTGYTTSARSISAAKARAALAASAVRPGWATRRS